MLTSFGLDFKVKYCNTLKFANPNVEWDSSLTNLLADNEIILFCQSLKLNIFPC